MTGSKHLYFGHPAAIKDEHLLSYFVPTAASETIADFKDRRCIVVGKKGGGKTALFRELSRPVKQTRIVVPISPKSHQLPPAKHALAYPQFANIFEFEILLEIIRSFVNNEEARKLFSKSFNAAAWLEGKEYLSKLVGAADLKELSIDTPVFGMGIGRADADTVLRLSGTRKIEKLRNRVLEIAALGVEILVLIDDPDLLFGDTAAFVNIVGGLLHTVVDLTALPAKYMKVCAFVKQHKYDYLARKFEDFDHIRQNSLTLSWSDPELVNLIAERVRFREELGKKATAIACWSKAFAIGTQTELQGITDYVFPRLTNGPRDLIEFCNRAMLSADESGRERIEWQDFAAAEPAYSRDCLDEVEREYGDVYPEVADVIQKLFEHPKLRKSDTLTKTLLTEAMSEQYLSDDLQQMKKDIRWLREETGRSLVDVLFKVGIVGLVSSGPSKARLMSYSRRSIADSVASAKTLFVHPAYFSALGIS